jgi:hypothetical protein
MPFALINRLDAAVADPQVRHLGLTVPIATPHQATYAVRPAVEFDGALELWRLPEPYLADAQNDATVMAIRAQEDAGLDIVSDGEIRRQSCCNRFATALEGVDIDNAGEALDRSGHPNPVPRVVGKIRRKHAVEVEDVRFLKVHTTRRVKITVPGLFTMSQQALPSCKSTSRICRLGRTRRANTDSKR